MIDRATGGEVLRRKLTYLSPDRLNSLYECMDAVRMGNVPGDFTEFGVALGGSGACMAAALDGDRRYFGFDVFGMIPPPTEIDGERVNARYKLIASGQSHGIAGSVYYGYIENLYDVVKATFSSLGLPVDDRRISLVRGLFADTLPNYGDVKIAVAHLDCDWYEPVAYCLNYVWPRLSPGGFIILDDYNDWEGCKKAADEFMASTNGVELVRLLPHAVIRKSLD
jgi:O-methyltransferase